MVRRFLCLLLVPLMLANQGAFFAHAHHGTDLTEPEDHAPRPHFHIGGHVHHDSTHHHDHDANHSHGDRPRNAPESDEHHETFPSVTSPTDEHDSDALYCGEPVNLARVGKPVSVLSATDVYVAAILHVDNPSDRLLRLGPLLGQPPSVFEAACPIYLRTLSLRL